MSGAPGSETRLPLEGHCASGHIAREFSAG
jgi:hypothetical protein